MKKAINPAAITPTVAVVLVDGAVSDDHEVTLAANSTLRVQNVSQGQVVRLTCTVGAGGPFTLAADGTPVQAIANVGAVASFACKASAVSQFEIVGRASGGVIVSQKWDGLYA